MLNVISGRHLVSPFFNESIPNVMCSMYSWACDVDFDVNMVEGIQEAFTGILDAYTEIISINEKINNLYDSADNVRSYIRMYEGYLHVYRIHRGNVYKSFEEIAGTLEHVNNMVRHYKEELDKIYGEPKRILEAERNKHVEKMHSIADSHMWVIDNEFSADPYKRPKIIVRSR